MHKRRRTVVTGATGGIGKVLCKRLASAGHNLILVGRDHSKLFALSAELKELFEGEYITHSLDFSTPVLGDSASETFFNECGEVQGLVVMPPQAPQTHDCLPPQDEWSDLFTRCFSNPLELIKVVIPQMGLNDRGKIVIVSGISSAQVLSHYATSNVLRCAWLAQAKTLAFALGQKNIHVNTLSLGGILTEKYLEGLVARGSNSGKTFDDQLAEETSNIPLRKYGTPSEVSEAILQLLGPFSDHITGANILCDGGFTRAY